MNAFRNITLAVLATSACLAAQGRASKVYWYGNTTWGGRVIVSGHANASRSFFNLTADLGGYANGRIYLNGNTREAFHLQGDVDGSGVLLWTGSGAQFLGTVTSQTLVRLAGRTIHRRVRTDRVQTSVGFGTQSLYGSTGFTFRRGIGPFSVTVRGNATADVDLLLRPAVSGGLIGAYVSADGDVYGRFSASAGVPGLRVGVRANVDLADPTASASLYTNFSSVSGRVCWSIPSIRMWIEVFARALFWSGDVTIINRSYSGTSGCRSFNINL